ncbi:hypothetical protein FH972_015150 [Carpinus fangiana]|uniref:Uncharacterized protein n=1 Tax=Carpinus fangiana TaxID=176857 RepID=A0A5N6RBX2_9ROSI|nr:hypothetical protein FH972_015150 [Carpinus fangiana]
MGGVEPRNKFQNQHLEGIPPRQTCAIPPRPCLSALQSSEGHLNYSKFACNPCKFIDNSCKH